jgi:hypothetical protein
MTRTHAGGVSNPRELSGELVPGLAELCGPVLACGEGRGSFRLSLDGYAALGQLLADVTGLAYAASLTVPGRATIVRHRPGGHHAAGRPLKYRVNQLDDAEADPQRVFRPRDAPARTLGVVAAISLTCLALTRVPSGPG